MGAGLASLAVFKARCPEADPIALWAIAAIAALFVFVAVPLQALAVAYVATILAATSRRSPVTSVSLAAGTIVGLATGLALYEVANAVQSDQYAGLLVLGLVIMLFLLAGLAGAAAAWLLPRTGDPQELWAARGRQGLLAGSVAGAVCGLLLTNLFVVAVFMMVIGPLVGAGGGLAVADHPPRSQPVRSWAAGRFVRF